ncbi:MAG: exo-alpha-sialidase [Pirellulales bacterium]|nr:exo-alpha-sialidase [Pirellulales bacterium]
MQTTSSADEIPDTIIAKLQQDDLLPQLAPLDDRELVAQQAQGDKVTALPANLTWISKPWHGENAQMPYLVYLSEKDRLLMLVQCQQPIRTAIITSDDRGKTWSDRRWLGVGKDGKPNCYGLGATYLGDGKLLAYPEECNVQWFSDDFGQTWQSRKPKAPAESTRMTWDPLLVLKGADGRIERLVQAWWKPTGIPFGSDEAPYSQAYLRSSIDEGRTWNDDSKIPQWLGINEVQIVRADNGDLIAACRTDSPKRFAKLQNDQFSGLGISISKDQGKTWSELKILYEYGRHHPSMVKLPSGQIVMTYVVRNGYPLSADGFPQFGIEAIASNDHGQTWDLSQRCILATWKGYTKEHNICSAQSTSTVHVGDSNFLTAFGTGIGNPSEKPANCKMDVALIRWHWNPSSAVANGCGK